MRKLRFLVVLGLLPILLFSVLWGQNEGRKVIDVPQVDRSEITLDAVMDEAAWENAAEANLVTATGYNIWYNPYGREMVEPDYDEFYGRMLWSKDTLFLFLHMDEFVNDSTGIWFGDAWQGDQLFVGLSNRLGKEMMGWYDGNTYAAPDGPYHWLILGDNITLNGDPDTTWIPESYRFSYADSFGTFKAEDYGEWATNIDSAEGVYDLEIAIHHPNISAQSSISFNIGGSNGSESHYLKEWDAYAYYCWQPSVPNDPFAPAGDEDPGAEVLKHSKNWPILNFVSDDPEVAVRKELEVPKVDPSEITFDAVMDEAAWENAAEANLVTATGYNIWYSAYGREMVEPDYDEFYGRMLWSKDTLFLFLHMDEFVNDSTGIWFGDAWQGDQLFVGLSNRLGKEMMGWYDGNTYAAPDGPYHWLILGEDISLNGDPDTVWIPEEYRFGHWDSLAIGSIKAENFGRWATNIDSAEGIYDLEMAIYHPNVDSQASIGFNIGGSNGSESHYLKEWDAYAYYCWQPSIPNDPFAPAGAEDPGAEILKLSKNWPVLTFGPTVTTQIESEEVNNKPVGFSLRQNYPNPFNPKTTIRFQVNKEVPVTLKVFDMLGREVATLIEERPFAQGTYSVIWNASNYASGVYFYKLSANNNYETKKMILLK
ncbi:MAG: T9SS type A sorting domain-containing protein [Candidatus Marinimicrobia bacterium]|nr:T9SS type A sorting domain-containing protein [Candidatus Neomarinimicrobiota bacterium]